MFKLDDFFKNLVICLLHVVTLINSSSIRINFFASRVVNV